MVVVLILLREPLFAAGNGDADDKALREVIQRFFTAYASKNLDAFIALGSEKSSGYEARKKVMAGLFAGAGAITVKGPTVVRTRRNGDAAAVRVRVELTVNDVITGKPRRGFGATDLVIELARECWRWKVMRYGPSGVWLMERLEETKSKADRLRLLD